MTDLLTVQAVARHLGIRQRGVLALIHSGELRAVTIAMQEGGRPQWRIAPEDLEAFIKRRTYQPTTRQTWRAARGRQAGRPSAQATAPAQLHLWDRRTRSRSSACGLAPSSPSASNRNWVEREVGARLAWEVGGSLAYLLPTRAAFAARRAAVRIRTHGALPSLGVRCSRRPPDGTRRVPLYALYYTGRKPPIEEETIRRKTLSNNNLAPVAQGIERRFPKP